MRIVFYVSQYEFQKRFDENSWYSATDSQMRIVMKRCCDYSFIVKTKTWMSKTLANNFRYSIDRFLVARKHSSLFRLRFPYNRAVHFFEIKKSQQRSFLLKEYGFVVFVWKKK